MCNDPTTTDPFWPRHGVMHRSKTTLVRIAAPTFAVLVGLGTVPACGSDSGDGGDGTGGAGADDGGDDGSGGDDGGDDGGSGGGSGGDGGGDDGSGGSGSDGGTTTGGGVEDEMPWFSFFVVSLPAIQDLCGIDGCGGNLGGLSGADQICADVAKLGNPTDGKQWRAFLSTTGNYGDMEKVDAIDRIGQGPWWNYDGRMLAPDLTNLMAGDRPQGGDMSLSDMFTDELGVDIQSVRNSAEGRDDPDNHDSVTGSDKEGRLYVADQGNGRYATCEDWTSDTLQGPVPPDGGPGGVIPVGHAWPRGFGGGPGGPGGGFGGADWVSDHNIAGCLPGINTGGGAGATDYTIGSGGGYGQWYCFALDAQPPG